jgi:23S rRNA (guanosine2251-2'-O)-methyltransferase
MAEISVRVGDKSELTQGKSSLIIVLDRLRSVHNVGNILRLADAVNALKVIGCGYTAMPPHPKLAKSAMGAELIVETAHSPSASEAILKLKNEGYTIVGVETVTDAVTYWDFKFPKKTCLVFGNEALGLQEDTLAVCDHFVSLPANGVKNSINVSNCAAVVMFSYQQQFR